MANIIISYLLFDIHRITLNNILWVEKKKILQHLAKKDLQLKSDNHELVVGATTGGQWTHHGGHQR